MGGRFLYERALGAVTSLSCPLDDSGSGDADDGFLILPLSLSCSVEEAVVSKFSEASCSGALEVASPCSPFLGLK